MKKKINVVVTGANGQLGITLKEYSKNSQDIDWRFYNSSELDITDAEQVKTVFEDKKVDYCINCAAYTNVEKAESEPEKANTVNYKGVKLLADTLKDRKTILVHISTDYVFDGEKEDPYTEDDIPNPINAYGKSKLLGEQYIIENLSRYFIIRTSWLYSQYGNNFLKTVINKLKAKQKMGVLTTQKGSPTSCNVLAEFIQYLILSKETGYGIYHLSAQGSTTWYGFAKHIETEFFASENALIEPNDSFKSVASRPQNSVLNNAKAQQIFANIEPWHVEVDKTVKKVLVENY